MKAPNEVGTNQLKKSPVASQRKTKTVDATKVMHRLTEPHDEKDFTALMQARRASALRGNSIEVRVDDL